MYQVESGDCIIEVNGEDVKCATGDEVVQAF